MTGQPYKHDGDTRTAILISYSANFATRQEAILADMYFSKNWANAFLYNGAMEFLIFSDLQFRRKRTKFFIPKKEEPFIFTIYSF